MYVGNIRKELSTIFELVTKQILFYNIESVVPIPIWLYKLQYQSYKNGKPHNRGGKNQSSISLSPTRILCQFDGCKQFLHKHWEKPFCQEHWEIKFLDKMSPNILYQRSPIFTSWLVEWGQVQVLCSSALDSHEWSFMCACLPPLTQTGFKQTVDW